MTLRAVEKKLKEKKQQKQQNSSESPSVGLEQKEGGAEYHPPANKDVFTHSITVQCNTLLYTTLQNMIISAHTAGDFTYSSVADIFRTALRAYKGGMQLTELEQAGKKRQTSIRVDEELHDFYRSWPSQLRTKILERVLRTFLKNQ